MPSLVASTASETELAVIAVVLGLVCVVAAGWARTRAPAVTVALVTGVLTGAVTFWIAYSGGPRGVPLVVLVPASAAMAASGFVSLWLLPGGAAATSLRRAALATLVAAPLVGLAALAAIQHACPLYVGRGAGACYYPPDQDVLGGWSATAALIVTLDMVLIAMLLAASEWRGRRSDRQAMSQVASKVDVSV